LERWGRGALERLATFISGQEATRVVLPRLLAPAAGVILGECAVVLDPLRTDIGDLVLCAALLASRSLVQRRGWDRVPEGNVRRWVRVTHQVLRLRYPGIHRLPGRFRPDFTGEVPEVAWRTLDWWPRISTDAVLAMEAQPEVDAGARDPVRELIELPPKTPPLSAGGLAPAWA
jgi:hypothetical protein